MGIAGEIAEGLRNTRDSIADTVGDIAEEVAEKVDDFVEDAADVVSELGEEFREGFQAGTEAMRPIVEKAWEQGIKISLDNAIEKISKIGEIILEGVEEYQEILDAIGQKLLEELLEYLSTLSIVVEFRAKGYARVQVSTSLFSYDIEFDICKGFSYQFELLDWTKVYLFYNIDNGLISFETKIHDKIVTKEWHKLKFYIPAVPIPKMLRKQCEPKEEEEGKDDESDNDDVTIVDGCGNKISLKDLDDLKPQFYTLKRDTYKHEYRRVTETIGSDYTAHDTYTNRVHKIERTKNSSGNKVWRFKTITTRADYHQGNRITGVNATQNDDCSITTINYGGVTYYPEEGEWEYINYVSHPLDKEGVKNVINVDKESIKADTEEKNYSREREISNSNCPSYVRKRKYVYIKKVKYHILPLGIQEEECNILEKETIKPETRRISDVPPIMNDEACCSMIRQILDLLGGEDWDATIPKSLTDGSDSTEKVTTIPDLIAKTIEYQDELAGSYPVEIEIEDSDLTQEGNQTISLKFPNQAEFLAEMYGMMYELMKNLTVTQELAFKAMTIAGLNQQALIKTRAQVETIQDYLDFSVNEKENKYPWLFTPGKQDWDKILEETEYPVKIQEYDEEEQTLKSQLIELMQGAAILRARYFRKVGNEFDFMKIIKQGASLGADFLENRQEGRKDKEWDDWKDFIEDDLMKKYDEGNVKPDIKDIRE